MQLSYRRLSYELNPSSSTTSADAVIGEYQILALLITTLHSAISISTTLIQAPYSNFY